MADGICDLDDRRPATHTVRVRQNGRETTLELCDVHYRQLRQQQSQTSPFESLFSGSPFGGFFGDDFGQLASNLGTPLPREREATNIGEFVSENTKEIIQQAAETAVKFERREVDTEHLLYALADSDVVQEIFKQFKLKSEDIKGYIEANAPKGTEKIKDVENIEVTVSPRVKQVLENAFTSSRELGHSYIGPEHLLIGLLQEDEGMAGDILRKYGLTPESLRQKIVKVVGQGAEEGRVQTQSTTPQLDKYSRDLSQLAKQNQTHARLPTTSKLQECPV